MKFCQKVMLVLSSLAVCLFLAELTLPRFFGFDLAETGWTWLHLTTPSADPHLRYELTPSFSGMMRGVSYAISSDGLRGEERSVGPSNSIVVLGDSITFGLGLPLEAIYPSLLQQALDPTGRNVGIYNLGVNGYDTLQEVALLKQRGLRHNPQLVIVGFCLNDIGIAGGGGQRLKEEISRLPRWLLRLNTPWFVIWRIHKFYARKEDAFLNSPEVFLSTYRDRIAPLNENESELRDMMGTVSQEYPSVLYGDPARVGRMRFAFQELGHLAQENSFAVLVVIIPILSQGQSYPHDMSHRIVAYEAERAGLSFLDLKDDLLEFGLERLKLDDRDELHPNKDGHRLIARTLAAHLKSLLYSSSRKGNQPLPYYPVRNMSYTLAP